MFSISCDYAYISDPPIFADIGTSYIVFDDLNTLINGTTFFDDNNTINVNLTKFDMSLHKFKIDYDGLSDFSIIVTNVVNSIANLIGSAIV